MPQTQLDVVRGIIDASRQGREIICLIGAGLSVDSGIPPLGKLTHYLAKVQGFIARAAFRPPVVASAGLNLSGQEFRTDPSRYLSKFGWPGPNQLNADLWHWIDQAFPKQRSSGFSGSLDAFVRAELIEDVLRFDAELKKGLGPEILKEREARLGKDPRRQLFGSKGWKDSFEKSGLWHVGGNWKTLLAHLTDANPDYADTLFQMLIRNRKPGMAQRFLAFLTPILGLRLFLTVNFDDLLEEALRFEGLHPVVYAVSRDSPLPHPSLVRSQLSVVKLHGDAFRLRIGEDLDYPLDEDSKKRLQEYLPKRPLLLVLGVGGNDRRVMDFVELVANPKLVTSATVYWLYFEDHCPDSVEDLRSRAPKDVICPVRTHSPAALLLELFSRLAGTHPPSFRGYDPKMPRPIDPSPVPAPETREQPVQIFLDDQRFDFGASLDLARFVAEKSRSHIPIWIDLEAMHTYEDVAVEVISQIRRYDPSVPPMALPGGPAPDADGVKKAVRRISDALLRDRYVVAFNGGTSFGRPPTWHDGLAPVEGVEVERKRSRESFLRHLVLAADPASKPSSNRPLCDSILAFSLDWDQVQDSQLRKVLQRWLPQKGGTTGKRPKEWEPVELLPGRWRRRHHDALLLLATFRRRRSYVALLQLLPKYLPDKTARQDLVDAFLKKVEHGYVLRVLGGEYWMCRGERDALYQGAKAGTRSWELAQAVRSGPRPLASDLALVRRLSLLARVHADIAGYCYSDLFASSSQSSALLEHLYHQVSSLRFLTKLDAWLELAYEGEPPQGVLDALGELIPHFPGLPEASQKEPRLFLRNLRLHRLRSLHRVLEREREAFLSEVFSDPLIGWIDWLRSSDIRRFLIASCLSSAEDAEAQAALAVRSDREPRLQALENDIERQCRELDRSLVDLKADALRDKMDFQGCHALRLEQIQHLLTKGLPKANIESFGELWTGCIRPYLKKGKELDPEISFSTAVRWLTRYQCDIWLCLRGQGDTKGAKQLQECTRVLIATAQKRLGSQPGQTSRDLEAMRIRWLRSLADHEQLGFSPWSLRGTGDVESVSERCRNTVRLCQEALSTLEWSSGKEYARHRSYFHSLWGRALYVEASILKGSGETIRARRSDLFSEAYRALDRAQAGIPPSIGANREALAISLLRLAECLMVRANVALDEAGSLNMHAELINADRRLSRAWGVLDRAEEMLLGARQNMEWWACLYQLRAQMQVEHLLREIVSPSEPGPGRELAPQPLLEGLNTVRQGLDVLLPVLRAGEEPQSHIRINRFLRIWLELMICAATRASTLLPGTTSVLSETEGLWSRWESLNRTAGLEALVQERILKEFKPLAMRLPTRNGLRARRRTLALVAESAHADKLQKLWNELVAFRGESKAR